MVITRAVPNIRFVFTLASDSRPNKLFAFGQIVLPLFRLCKYWKLNLNTFALSCCIATLCRLPASSQMNACRHTAGVFISNFEYPTVKATRRPSLFTVSIPFNFVHCNNTVMPHSHYVHGQAIHSYKRTAAHPRLSVDIRCRVVCSDAIGHCMEICITQQQGCARGII